jgi:hypothetical protein
MEEINTQNITKLNHVLHIQYVYTEIATWFNLFGKILNNKFNHSPFIQNKAP